MSVIVVPREISLSLIRRFEIRCNNEPIALSPSSQRLLSFLALHPEPVRRNVASGSLWMDADEHHASASLRSALWRLHSLNVVCTSSSQLWLNPEVDVDLHRVVGDALSVLRTPLADDTLVPLARELIDVGDEILPGVYEDWVVAEREQFRLLRLNALDRIGECLLATGNWYDALQVGLAATRVDPLRESSHRLLVRVNLEQGNTAEAVRQYRLYAKLLHIAFGGQPTQLFRDLITPFLLVHAD